MLSKQLFFLACNFFLLEGLWFVEGPLTYWEIPQQPSWHGSFTSYHHDCSAGYRTRRIFWGASWGSGTDSHGVYKNIINNEAQDFTLVPRAMARLCGQQPPLAQLAISRLGRWALQMGSSLPLHTVRSTAPFMHWMWKQAEFCRSTNSIQRCIRRWQLCVSTRRHWTCSTWFCKSWWRGQCLLHWRRTMKIWCQGVPPTKFSWMDENLSCICQHRDVVHVAGSYCITQDFQCAILFIT